MKQWYNTAKSNGVYILAIVSDISTNVNKQADLGIGA